MDLPPPSWFAELFPLLLSGRDLPPGRATEVVRDFVSGRVDDARGAAILTALRMKGESAEEIADAALVLREQMVRLVPVSGPVLDTCGTGGDDSGTFNISTAAALVACGAGVPDWMAALFDGLDDDPETRRLVAASIAAEQCRRLQAEGVDEFHFYTLNRADLAVAICHMIGARAPAPQLAAVAGAD